MPYKMPNPTSLTHDERMYYRKSQLWLECRDAIPETLNDGSALYAGDANGRFYLQAFAGKALRMYRPISGYYRTTTSRDEAIEKFKQSREQHHERQRQKRQEARKPHTLKKGDILSSSWGYEQTNVEFYEVMAVSGSMVTVCELATSTTETGFMSGEKIPHPGLFFGEPICRRANAHNHIKINSHIFASPWSGRPQFVSWYA